MAEEIGSLVVRVGADITELLEGVAGGKRELASLQSEAISLGKGLAGMAAAAAAAGAAVAVALTAKGLEAVDAQAKLAAQLNTTTDSLAAVKRAGDLSGASMEQIAAGSQKLAVYLGQAASGGKAQSETLARLGLDAAHLASIPLDERILAVNQAINENIPAVERAAVASEMFGKSAGMAMLSMSPDAIRQAKEETELFGTAISSIDAAKVEAANDAMSVFGLAVDGVSQQLAVQLAPVITAVSDMFKESVKDAGGIGPAVESGVDIAIDAVGFLMDMFDGLNRVFQLVAKSIVVAGLYIEKKMWEVADAVVNGPTGAINDMIEMMNKIPGVDIEPVALTNLGETIKAELQTATGAVDMAVADMDAILSEPMASEKFRQFVEDARVAGQAAAEAAVQARQAVTGGGAGAAAAGGDKASDKEREELEKRLEAIRVANMSEVALLQEKQMMEIDAINAGWEQKILTEEEWNLRMQETKSRHEQEMSAIEERSAQERAKIAEAEAKAKQQILGGALSGLTTLMNSENRKMFEIGKTAAIAQSLISTYTGMNKALELGWPLGPIAAGAIALTGFANVQSIRAQSFGGGGGGGVSNTQAINAASTPTGGNPAAAGGTLTVRGLDAGSLFTGDAVGQIAEQLLDYQRRGGQVILA